MSDTESEVNLNLNNISILSTPINQNISIQPHRMDTHTTIPHTIPTIQQFTGADWDKFYFRLKTILSARNLDSHLSSNPPTDDTVLEKWKLEDKWCIGVLTQALKDEDMRRIMTCETIKGMIDELKKVYVKSPHLCKATTIHAITSLHQLDTDTICAHIDRFNNLLQSFAAAGGDPKNDLIPPLFVLSLSSS